MGEHEKPETPLGEGTPPPDNADGRVPQEPEPEGKHKK
jgi:hypothetical protein